MCANIIFLIPKQNYKPIKMALLQLKFDFCCGTAKWKTEIFILIFTSTCFHVFILAISQ